jgi:MoxR-like ATPase
MSEVVTLEDGLQIIASTSTINKLEQALQQLDQVILGKSQQVRLAITCLLAGGHLLIEDLPGMGKTVLAHALAHTLGLDFKRVQFTSDLLPSDIIGTNIFDRKNSTFHFREGPLFSRLLLADEINRATPKSQSALLEAMEEQHVSVDGNTYPLPLPFFVIATQNPSDHLGTFPLPEAQLDRFLIRIELGYANKAAELELLKGTDRRTLLKQLSAVLSPEEILVIQQQVEKIEASDALLEYLYEIVDFTRQSGWFMSGLSTRAALMLLKAAKAWALLHGQIQVVPGDLQAVLPGVVDHRLQVAEAGVGRKSVGKDIIEAIAIP